MRQGRSTPTTMRSCAPSGRHITRSDAYRPLITHCTTALPGRQGRKAVRGALGPRLVPRLVPGRPAARRLAVHHQVTRSPLVPVLAALRVTPPVGTLHLHSPIRTRERSEAATRTGIPADPPRCAGYPAVLPKSWDLTQSAAGLPRHRRPRSGTPRTWRSSRPGRPAPAHPHTPG